MWRKRCECSWRQCPQIHWQNWWGDNILVITRSPWDMPACWWCFSTNKSVQNSQALDLPPLWRVLLIRWSRKIRITLSIFPMRPWNNKCCPGSARFPQLHCDSIVWGSRRSYPSCLVMYWHCKDKCYQLVNIWRRWEGEVSLWKQKGWEKDAVNEKP